MRAGGIPTAHAQNFKDPQPLLSDVIPHLTLLSPIKKQNSPLYSMYPCPSRDFRPQTRKKLSIIASEYIFPQIPVIAHVFRSTMMTYLEKLVGIKPLV